MLYAHKSVPMKYSQLIVCESVFGQATCSVDEVLHVQITESAGALAFFYRKP